MERNESGATVGTDDASAPITAVPEWLQDVDGEERAELQELGADIAGSAKSKDQAAVQDGAMRVMKRFAVHNAETARLRERWLRELQLVDEVYRPQMERMEKTSAALKHLLGQLARLVDYGKRKSMAFAYGVISRKDFKGGTLRVTDKAQCARHLYNIASSEAAPQLDDEADAAKADAEQALRTDAAHAIRCTVQLSLHELRCINAALRARDESGPGLDLDALTLDEGGATKMDVLVDDVRTFYELHKGALGGELLDGTDIEESRSEFKAEPIEPRIVRALAQDEAQR